MSEEIITINRERYEELIKAEARIQFLTAYCLHEAFPSNADILFYLGISLSKSEPKKEDEDNDGKED